MAPLTRGLVVCLSLLGLCAGDVRAQLRGQNPEEEVGDGTRVSGQPEVTCTPDVKSKAAGAAEFEDLITLSEDRVESKELSRRGFPESMSIPKTVDGVITLNVSFKKRNGDKATYLLRLKEDGVVGGSLTIVENKKRFRYLVRKKGAPAPSDPVESSAANAGGKSGKAAESKGAKGDAVQSDPAVIRVDGGFVRLMTTNVALTEARVTDKAKKARVGEIQKAAGTDWQALKGTYLAGDLSAAEYVEVAGRRLGEANRELAALLGDDIADLDAAYARPVAAEFLYHNAMRAAIAELGDAPKGPAAIKAVSQSMVDLAKLVLNKAGREADVLAKFRELTDARVKKVLPAPQWTRVQKTVKDLTSYRPGAGADDPTPAPAERPPLTVPPGVP